MDLSQLVNLSERSRDLIHDYTQLGHLNEIIFANEFEQLFYWLTFKDILPTAKISGSSQEYELLWSSLQAELLKDLLLSLGGDDTTLPSSPKNSSLKKNVKFALLAFSGTMLAACEGFDSITSLMSVFPIPALAILIIGIAFSILSVLFFYGFSLVQISQDLGVKLSDTPKLLDLYLLQMQEIKMIRKLINSYNFASLSSDDLNQLARVINVLQSRLQAIHKKGKQFDESMNNKGVLIAEMVLSLIAGILFFGSGYFAGQSVALFILGFFVTSVAPVFWPVILFSIAIGLAAFILYWNLERPGIKKVIGNWMGLDEEKIEKLTSSEQVLKQEKKLQHLKTNLETTQELIDDFQELKTKIHTDKSIPSISGNIYLLQASPKSHSETDLYKPQNCYNEYYAHNPSYSSG